MSEPKKPTVIYVDKKDLNDFRNLVKEKYSPFADCQSKEVFLAAMVIGYHEGGRIPLKKKEGFFREEYLSDEERALMRAVAVSSEGDLNVLLNEQKTYSIAEEYATGGIALLKARILSGEYGSYAKRLESELLRTFQKISEKEPKRQTPQELAKLSVDELIKSGESDSVEFKSSLIWDYKKKQSSKIVSMIVARTVSCFMNSEGGVIVVGVSNDQKILGLNNDLAQLHNSLDDFELHFTNVINKYLGKVNRPFVAVGFESIDDKTVAIIQVGKSPRPVYLKYEGEPKFFIRLGNSCQELDISEATLYIRHHWPNLR